MVMTDSSGGFGAPKREPQHEHHRDGSASAVTVITPAQRGVIWRTKTA
jgi:hypothetical protein